MKRIALVIHAISAGGAERVMVTMANHWAREGREVVLLTLDDGSKPPFYELDSGVVHRSLGVAGVSSNLWHSLVNNVRRVGALRAAIKRVGPDAVISFMSSVNVIVLLSTIGLKMPVIVSERVDPRFHPIGRVWEVLRWIFYRRASRVVGQSAEAVEHLPRGGRSVVIPNPVLASLKGGHGDAARVTRNPLRRRISTMGRLEEQKGFDLLIKVFSRLAGRHPQWELQIFGEGSCRTYLEADVQRAGLKDRVFLPGVTRNPVLELQRSDLFVLASRYEGFPNVLCEAMACGLPVISFDCPSGPREIISDGNDGILVPAGDLEGLERAMDQLMSSEADRKRLAACAPQIVKRFAVDRVMGQWLSLVDEVILEAAMKGQPEG